MSKIVFAVLAFATTMLSCGDNRKEKTYSGFIAIPREAAIKMITSYTDSRVPHDIGNIIKSIQLNSKEFEALAGGSDSVRLFTAADTVTYMPAIVIQTITRNSPLSYEYYLFQEGKGSICPPPNDCYIELSVATQ